MLRRGLALAICLASAGCAGTRPPAAGSAAPAPSAKASNSLGESVDVSELRFISPEDERRFNVLRAFCAERAQGLPSVHEPLRKDGSLVKELWGFPPEAGWTWFSGAACNKRGIGWYSVETAAGVERWPAVCSVRLEAVNNPRQGEWGVHLYYYQHTGLPGSSLLVDFSRFKGDLVTAKVPVGDSLEYEAADTRISVSAPGDPAAMLRLLYLSPASFKQTALARYDALLAEVEKAFREHRVEKLVVVQKASASVTPPRRKWAGPGAIPPLRKRVPLTPDEEKAGLEKARKELAEIELTLEQNYEGFYRLMVELVPYDRCFK